MERWVWAILVIWPASSACVGIYGRRVLPRTAQMDVPINLPGSSLRVRRDMALLAGLTVSILLSAIGVWTAFGGLRDDLFPVVILGALVPAPLPVIQFFSCRRAIVEYEAAQAADSKKFDPRTLSPRKSASR